MLQHELVVWACCFSRDEQDVPRLRVAKRENEVICRVVLSGLQLEGGGGTIALGVTVCARPVRELLKCKAKQFLALALLNIGEEQKQCLIA